MTKLEKEKIRAFLTGRVPLHLRADKIEVPSDNSIKDFILMLSADELMKIGGGPSGNEFRLKTKAALARLAEVRNPTTKASSRGQGILWEFEEHEVLRSVVPEKSED